jgi:hypothetical protein
VLKKLVSRNDNINLIQQSNLRIIGMIFFFYVVTLLLITKSAFGNVSTTLINEQNIPRVSVQTYNQGTIMPIYLTPGRASVIDFPCLVTKASMGSGGDIHAVLATSVGNEVDLKLDSSVSQATNLIVRCKEAVFIFDIIPSINTHQEYIKIKNTHGALKYHSNMSDLVNVEPTLKGKIGINTESESMSLKNNNFQEAKKYNYSKLQKISSGVILKNSKVKQIIERVDK